MKNVAFRNGKTVTLPKMPGSFEESLSELKRDREFLLKDNVFTEDVIDAWIENKIERELNPVRLRPTPPEFDICGWKCGRAARRGEFCCDGSRQLQAAFAGESRAPADAKHGARASRTGEEDKEWRTIAIDKSCVT